MIFCKLLWNNVYREKRIMNKSEFEICNWNLNYF